MHINWNSIEEQLKSPNARRDEINRVNFAEKEHVRSAFREETAELVAALVALRHRLADAGFPAVALTTPPDYSVKVAHHSVGIQVSLAGPSWLVLNDGHQTDEIIYNGERDRGYWALVANPTTRLDLAAYFEKQFGAFVERIRPERRISEQ
jgi:hypothetical protein